MRGAPPRRAEISQVSFNGVLGEKTPPAIPPTLQPASPPRPRPERRTLYEGLPHRAGPICLWLSLHRRPNREQTWTFSLSALAPRP